jgi:hypothetical protein
MTKTFSQRRRRRGRRHTQMETWNRVTKCLALCVRAAEQGMDRLWIHQHITSRMKNMLWTRFRVRVYHIQEKLYICIFHHDFQQGQDFLFTSSTNGSPNKFRPEGRYPLIPNVSIPS